MEFGWVDFSEEDKRATLALCDAAKDHRAIDELGIGIVRDAFADAFFPATSTVMTRLRYFYLVPYLGIQLERESNRHASQRSVANEFDRKEKRLARMLMEGNGAVRQGTANDDESGIIGSRTLKSSNYHEWVKRTPAEIYWNPLRQLGFHRQPNFSRREMFERAATQESLIESFHVIEDDEEVEGASDDRTARQSLWNLKGELFSAWNTTEYKTKHISILPTQAEAEDFQTRYQNIFSDSLMALMLRDSRLVETALSADNFSAFARTALEAHSDVIPERIHRLLEAAITFDELTFGCFVRYNLLTGNDEAQELWEEAESAMTKAAKRLDLDELEQLLGLSVHRGWKDAPGTSLKRFLADVQSAVIAGELAKLDQIIEWREKRLKTTKAKIGAGSNGEWIGQWHLSYRFGIAARLLEDVRNARPSAKEVPDVRP